MAAIPIGNPGSNTNPAIAIGNEGTDWTVLLTQTTLSAAGISATVLGIATESSSGAVSGPLLVSADASGNVGIANSLHVSGSALVSGSATVAGSAAIAGSTTIGGSVTVVGEATIQGASILAGSGAPTTALAPALGSIYLRNDSTETTGPRMYQFTSQYVGTPQSQWLEIPLGLGMFNVKDYGALGLGVGDDTVAIQSAITAAENFPIVSGPGSASGATVYFPPGSYRVFATELNSLLITGANNLTLAGVGSASQINAIHDMDVFYVSGGANGLTIRDMQIQFAKSSSLPLGAVSGAAMHFDGGGAQYRIENVDTAGVAIGLLANNKSGAGRITNCTIQGNIVGGYFTAGAEIHHCHFSGSTYGIVSDGANGLKMTNVALFGSLSLATWCTIAAPLLNTPSVYCYDVEANYSDPYDQFFGKETTTATNAIPLSGIGSTYNIPFGPTPISPAPAPGQVVYISGSGYALGGYITSATTTDIVMRSDWGLTSGTVPASALVWINGPPYPSQVGGEGEGSASLITAGQAHLVDCWFQGGTVIGGSPPTVNTTTLESFTTSGMSGSIYSVTVQNPSGFLNGSEIYVTDGAVSGQITGSVISIGTGEGAALSFTSIAEDATTSGTMLSGAFVSQAFTMANRTYLPAPFSKTNAYPFAPDSVTVQGGNWAEPGAPKYITGAVVLTSNAIEVDAGTNVVISDCNISTGSQNVGYGILISGAVSGVSIVGNNLSIGNDSAGAIAIQPANGVSCAGNVIVGATPSGAITWPATTTQPFAVAHNPGFLASTITSGFTVGPEIGDAVNTYGVPGTFYVSGGSDVLSITITVNGAQVSTGLTSGAFHVEPGDVLQIDTGEGTPANVRFIGG